MTRAFDASQESMHNITYICFEQIGTAAPTTEHGRMTLFKANQVQNFPPHHPRTTIRIPKQRNALRTAAGRIVQRGKQADQQPSASQRTQQHGRQKCTRIDAQ
ncbi:hypothetical protein Nepgr_033574 [Nepenthes gracilis]|uniref:Uncharacterized protein n=1 Tax=Nepenthes gracilis TaxID=150966 RepID=A0AAD3TKP7_NEPGR|nr:hypothetical protein Nepgr_033574 [Nepenthes gracilis]